MHICVYTYNSLIIRGDSHSWARQKPGVSNFIRFSHWVAGTYVLAPSAVTSQDTHQQKTKSEAEPPGVGCRLLKWLSLCSLSPHLPL